MKRLNLGRKGLSVGKLSPLKPSQIYIESKNLHTYSRKNTGKGLNSPTLSPFPSSLPEHRCGWRSPVHRRPTHSSPVDAIASCLPGRLFAPRR
jgi:hypothetical protein